MSGAFDWEETALRLLEMNLNGETLNSDRLKDLFMDAPAVLQELDIINEEGATVDNIDMALYGGRPKIVEIRELKPVEVHHCRACNRSFKRADNFRRHLASALHARRTKALELAHEIHDEEKLEEKRSQAVKVI